MDFIFLLAPFTIAVISLIAFLFSQDYSHNKSYFGGGFVASLVIFVFLFIGYLASSENTGYECSCEVNELVTDRVVHYNKLTGDTTITTFIDISKCISVE